jgi:hypothetical protein
MVRDKVQATNKGHDYSRSNSDHCWRDSRQVTLLFLELLFLRREGAGWPRRT